MCETVSFVDMSSPTTLVQQAEAWWLERKKSAQAQRGSLFSGRTHAGSLLQAYFIGLDIFSHQYPFRIYTFFHAESLTPQRPLFIFSCKICYNKNKKG